MSLPSTISANSITVELSSIRAMADMIGIYHGRLEEVPGDFRKKAIAASHSPSDAERKAMREYGLELRQRLAGGGLANSSPVARLVNAWPSYGADAKSTAVVVKGYVEVLMSLPMWAVEQAVERFRSNRATVKWDAGKMPAEPLVVEETRAITAPLDLDLARITAVLRAEVYQPMSEADRAKMDKAIADWTAKRALEKGRGQRPEAPDEFEARLREIGRVDGLTLSEGAR